MAERRLGGGALAATGLAVALTLLGVLVGESMLSVLLTPLVLMLLIAAMVQIPLRYSLMGLMFLAFTLENPAEQPADGRWKSPFFDVGGILLNHMNTVDRSLTFTSGIFFSGMDICLVALLLIGYYRRIGGSKLDRAGHLVTPRPLLRLAQLSLVGMMVIWLGGIVRGGNFGISLWQLDRIMYLPIVFILFHWGLRGPKDMGDLARVVCAAAVFRALFAVYVMKVADIEPVKDAPWLRPAYATTHHDSMLFALAFVLLIVLSFERVLGWTKSIPLLLIVSAGIAANSRRMAWLLIGASFATWYLVSPDNPVKKRLRRLVFYSIPAVVVYLIVGWNGTHKLFKPIRILRSVTDAQSDASSYWREMENYNIVATFRDHMFIGTGYGHGFNEYVPLPAVAYPLERFIPHNSLLGMWCYGGYVGYTALTLLWMGGVYFAMRAYRATTDRKQRAAATMCVCAVVVYLLQGWGDMGIGAWTGVFLTASALAMAGKLAVANGQWGTKSKSVNPTPPTPGRVDARQAA